MSQLMKIEWTKEVEAAVKTSVAKGCSDAEYFIFSHLCKKFNLDPFMKQVHAIPIWDSGAGRNVMQTILGIGGYRALADRTGNYAPSDRATELSFDDRGMPVYAKVWIKKRTVDGTWHDVFGEAWYDECVKMKGKGDQREANATWRERAKSQLIKCAEMASIKKAFPDICGDLPSSEAEAQHYSDDVETIEVPGVTAEMHEFLALELSKCPENFRKMVTNNVVDKKKGFKNLTSEDYEILLNRIQEKLKEVEKANLEMDLKTGEVINAA